MIDKIGRNIEYIRISLTDRCNLRCSYCMPETQDEFMCGKNLMTAEEILEIVRILAQEGIRKVRLTGGEPLLRKDIIEIAAGIKRIPGIEQIALTTNGVLLKGRMKALAEAGISSVNISLDTMNPAKHREIVKRDVLGQVLEGIEEALKYPGVTVKLNCVAIGPDIENIAELAGMAKDRNLHVRFIEMMPIGYGTGCRVCSEEYIKEVLRKAYGEMTACEGPSGNGPSRYYQIDGFKGKVGFISAITHKFCSGCNRIRLTADGQLKTCLQYEGVLNLKDMLRSGVSRSEMQEKIREEVFSKPAGHHFCQEGTKEDEKRGMASIGG